MAPGRERAHLVLFAHGSRDPLWRAPFESLLSRLRADLGEDRVSLAFMEFAPPDLEEAVAGARRAGYGFFRLLPLFLAGGAHVATDIPEQVARLRKRFPEIVVEVLRPVGEDARFADLMVTVAREAAARE